MAFLIFFRYWGLNMAAGACGGGGSCWPNGGQEAERGERKGPGRKFKSMPSVTCFL
jgi:hypothetical protein